MRRFEFCFTHMHAPRMCIMVYTVYTEFYKLVGCVLVTTSLVKL